MQINKTNSGLIRKIFTAIILFVFIFIGLVDAIIHNKPSYSSIMGMDIHRVYFYTFYLLLIGCWLLYHRLFVGIGFITLATFSSYFFEFISLHNYFASIMIYIGLIIDIIHTRELFWILPFIVLGLIQGIAFQTPQFNHYIVGSMEFLSLCIGSVFIVREI